MAKTNVTVELRGDASHLTRAGRSAVGTLKRVGAAASQVVGSITRIGAAAGLAGGFALAKLGSDAAQSVDAVAKLAQNLDTTGTKVRELQLAGELSGIGAEGATKAYQTLVRVFGDAQRGLKSAQDAFQALGLDVKTFGEDIKDPAKALEAVAGGLAKIEQPALRASVSSVVFGREWRKITPLLQDAAATFERTRRIYEGLGFSLDKGAGSVVALKDNWTDLVGIGTAMRDQVFLELAPLINKVVSRVGELARKWILANGGAEKLAGILAGKLVSGFNSVLSVIQAVQPVLEFFGDTLSVILKGLRFLGQLGGAVAAAGVQAAQGNFSGAGAILSEDLGQVFDDANPESGGASKELADQTDLLRQILEAVKNQTSEAQFG